MTLALTLAIVVVVVVFACLALVIFDPRRQPPAPVDPLQLDLVLRALISDRERLVSAVLARESPLAAQALGMVDREQSRVHGARTVEELMRSTAKDRRDNEFETEDGQPVVPVGFDGG